jgi:tRNA threonylcarbamoyl adenosine modification protein (Sua5/YciO/YrdC/YwlC family)
MRVINLDISNPVKFSLAIEEAIDCLKNGGVIVYPTDTIYGFGCDALNEKAVEKIYKIKKRKNNKPLSVMMRNTEELKKYAYLDVRNIKILETILPGPYTLILPGAKKLPPAVTGDSANIGIRIPNHPVAQKLSEAFENPIVSTSVNISESDPLSDPFKIVDLFSRETFQPDLVLDFGKLKSAKPSIIIDLTRRNPQIIRSGMMNVKETMELLEKLK